MSAEIIPAILVKGRKELLERITLVAPHVKTVQIDVMDGKFVPNTTVGIDELGDLPQSVSYEFHWMVENPWEWIVQTKGAAMHLVHVETLSSRDDWEKVISAAAKAGGKVGIVLNPDTYLDKIYPYAKEISQILIMSVRPGFSGQSYIREMEQKIHDARTAFPEMDIEVDGGIGPETIVGARKAGANKLVAASAIYAQPDAGKAIAELKKLVGE